MRQDSKKVLAVIKFVNFACIKKVVLFGRRASAKHNAILSVFCVLCLANCTRVQPVR
jgi:hypothetical protein